MRNWSRALRRPGLAGNSKKTFSRRGAAGGSAQNTGTAIARAHERASPWMTRNRDSARGRSKCTTVITSRRGSTDPLIKNESQLLRTRIHWPPPLKSPSAQSSATSSIGPSFGARSIRAYHPFQIPGRWEKRIIGTGRSRQAGAKTISAEWCARCACSTALNLEPHIPSPFRAEAGCDLPACEAITTGPHSSARTGMEPAERGRRCPTQVSPPPFMSILDARLSHGSWTTPRAAVGLALHHSLDVGAGRRRPEYLRQERRTRPALPAPPASSTQKSGEPACRFTTAHRLDSARGSSPGAPGPQRRNGLGLAGRVVSAVSGSCSRSERSG